MRDINQIKKDLELFSKYEIRAILDAWKAGSMSPGFISCLAEARRRTLRRRLVDAQSDHARRTLVGARVPREFYEKCCQIASERGISLYRFTIDALTAACDNRTDVRMERENPLHDE